MLRKPESKLAVAGLAFLALACTTTQPTPPQVTCTTQLVPPPTTAARPALWEVADPTFDLLLDHPVFAEVYDVVYADYSVIPEALDLVRTEVRRGETGHTFRIATRGGDLAAEMRDESQRVALGVYVDVDANGISDYLLTTTGPSGGIIVTPGFERVADLRGLAVEERAVTMLLPRDLASEVAGWVAFSAFSPTTAAHPTASEELLFVPRVDIVSSGQNMGGMVTSYVGPGSCQVTENWIVLNDGSRYAECPASPPYKQVPGTSTQGKLWWGKQCGAQSVQFWCVAAAFGTRVASPAGQGWVGKCPYKCGWNELNQWDTTQNKLYDKTYHTIRDADCSAMADVKKHYNQDNDGFLDVMAHTYHFSTDKLESCNLERELSTGQLKNKRCCPARAPYASQSSVPGSVDGATSPYNCPTGAP